MRSDKHKSNLSPTRVNRDEDQKRQQFTESRAPLRVSFLPFWLENPYQSRLSDELASLGVSMPQLGRTAGSVLGRLFSKRPQVIHLHWLDPLHESRNSFLSAIKLTASLVVLSSLRLIGVRIVWTAHNLKQHEGGNSRVDRLCTRSIARLSQAIIAHCPSAKDKIVQEFKLSNPDRVHVIPHGNYCDSYENKVDSTAARRRLSISADKLVFLFLGRVRPYKGVLEMIGAFRRLCTSDALLVIAGKPLTVEAEADINEAINGDDRIRFDSGFVPDERIQIYMNACDIVVLPYRNVFTSGAAVLAMSFARACIAPALGCMTDWFDDDGAFLYSPDDPDGLYGSMKKASNSRAGLNDMGHRNGLLALQWNWANVAHETNRVYQSLMSPDRPHSSKGSGTTGTKATT